MNLKKILPVPFSNETEYEWAIFFERLGTNLPKDYVDFISNYGSGIINNYIIIYSPFAELEYLELSRNIKSIRTALEKHNNIYDFSIYPAKGGILPFGHTNDGDYLCWETNGEPEEWSIFISGNEGKNVKFKVNFHDFLYKVLLGEIICDSFSEDLIEQKPSFKTL